MFAELSIVGFVLKPVGPETLILDELWPFLNVQNKNRFRETMFAELSIVGFAPSGSYYRPLVLKPNIWTS